MKALSLWQPWATLIALGKKKIETRAWQTAYRGPLAIHAAQKMTREMKLLCEREPFASALDHVFAAGDELPLGAIVAVCELHSIWHIESVSTQHFLRIGMNLKLVTSPELNFGDYTSGRYGWILTNVRRLDAPIPCRGAQGIFEVPRDVLAQIEAQR